MKKQFVKKAVLITMFVLPLVVMIGLIVLRKEHPYPGEIESGAGKPLAKSKSDYIALESSWLTNKYQTLSGLDEEALLHQVKSLQVRAGKSETSKLQLDSLYSCLTKTLKSFEANQFSNFMQFAVQAETYSYDPIFIKGFGKAIASNFHKDTSLTPQDVVETWWRTNSGSGSWSEKIFNGICWDQSFVMFENITSKTNLDAQPFVNSLQKNILNCGVSGTDSIFVYSPTPRTVLSVNKSVLMADVVLLSKFQYNNELTAFPLILRYYWVSNDQKWFPYYMAWGYSGPIPPLPVF